MRAAEISGGREREVRVRPERKRESEVERGKNNKISNARTIGIVHICTVTVTLVHLCIILHPLMWVFFFFIKRYKIPYFFYFARLCNH